MVAPCQMDGPVKSLVRVARGNTATTRTLCWDLSRASSLAAAVPVQQSLTPQTVVDSVGNTSKPKKEEQPSTLSDSQPPCPQGPLPTTSSAVKRPREEDQENGADGKHHPVSKVARTSGSLGEMASSSSQSRLSLEELVQTLLQECKSLRQQNENLQRRLGLFHGLFRDKHRLHSFVRHLDTLVK